MSITDNADVNLTKGIMFYCGVSFLAGYSFTKNAEGLDTISDVLFGKKSQNQKNG